MNKTRTNISVKTNTGSRRKVDIIAGDNGPYVSGDILDANAVKLIIEDEIAAQAGGDVDYVTEQQLKECIEVTHGEITALRNAGNLISGKYYRITDYVATTVLEDSRSANNPFDIIVLAISPSRLNEDAYATIHEGNTYFSNANANLHRWRLKYTIDNDDSLFGWADTANGKGVIYDMIDEWNNRAPYDFKGILFARHKITAVNTQLGYNSATVDKYVAIYNSTSNTYFPSDASSDGTKGWYYTFSISLEDNTDYTTYHCLYYNFITIAHDNYIGPYKKDNKCNLNNIVVVGVNNRKSSLDNTSYNIFRMSANVTIAAISVYTNVFYNINGVFIFCELSSIYDNMIIESNGILIEGAVNDNYFYKSGGIKSFARRRIGSNLDGTPVYTTVYLQNNILYNSGGSSVYRNLTSNIIYKSGGNNIMGSLSENLMYNCGGCTFNSDVFRSDLRNAGGNLFNLISDSTIVNVSGCTLSNIDTCTMKSFSGARFIGNGRDSSNIYTLNACNIVKPNGIGGLTISLAGTSTSISGVTFDLSKYNYLPQSIIIKNNASRITTTTGQDIVQLDTLGNEIQ